MANSRLKEAFVQSPNLIGLATVAAVSLAQLNTVPLLVGAVAEAAYLLFAPDTRWIAQKVDRQAQSEDEKRKAAARAQLLEVIRPDLRARFERLQARRDEIGSAVGESAAWYKEELLRNLDYLLDKFLLFASKEAQFRAYLLSIRAEEQDLGSRRGGKRPSDDVDGTQQETSVNWAMQAVEQVSSRYAERQKALAERAEKEQDPDARALLGKRAEVLARRKDYLDKAGHAFTNIHQQLTLLEDTFGLVNDEIRARPAEDIKADLDGVLATTESMTTSLDEMAELEQSLSVGTQSS